MTRYRENWLNNCPDGKVRVITNSENPFLESEFKEYGKEEADK